MGKKRQVKKIDIRELILGELIESFRLLGEDYISDLLTDNLTDFNLLLEKVKELNSTLFLEERLNSELVKNDEGEVISSPINLLKIKDSFIKPNFISSIKKSINYDDTTNKIVFQIIINDESDSKVWFSNMIFNFSSKEERDFEFLMLKKRMLLFNLKIK